MEQHQAGGMESVLLVVETNDPIALFFTETRIIVADLGRPSAASGLSTFGGAVGGAIAGLAEERRRSKKLEELRGLPPERILISSEKSYALSYARISAVTFEKKMFGKLVRIAAQGRSHDFFVKRPKEIPNYALVLSRVLGSERVST